MPAERAAKASNQSVTIRSVYRIRIVEGSLRYCKSIGKIINSASGKVPALFSYFVLILRQEQNERSLIINVDVDVDGRNIYHAYLAHIRMKSIPHSS